MIQVISYEMKKLSGLLFFASALTIDKVHDLLDTIEKMLQDEKNFDPVGSQPLTLSKHGINILKRIDPSIPMLTLLGSIKKIDQAIQLGSLENEDLQEIDKYLQKTLRRTSGKWINVDLRGMNFEKARQAILDDAIKPMWNAFKEVNAPEIK